MEKIVLYLAGGLFNAGERLNNLMLEKHLKLLGYTVVLPQREAKRFFKDGLFDIGGVVEDCYNHSRNYSGLLVGNIDGPDADSGTAVEIGIAVSTTSRAIVYRTDFRTDPKRELGVNAMLRLPGTKFIYRPALFTELEEVEGYYRALAAEIHEWVKKVYLGNFREPLAAQENA